MIGELLRNCSFSCHAAAATCLKWYSYVTSWNSLVVLVYIGALLNVHIMCYWGWLALSYAHCLFSCTDLLHWDNISYRKPHWLKSLLFCDMHWVNWDKSCLHAPLSASCTCLLYASDCAGAIPMAGATSDGISCALPWWSCITVRGPMIPSIALCAIAEPPPNAIPCMTPPNNPLASPPPAPCCVCAPYAGCCACGCWDCWCWGGWGLVAGGCAYECCCWRVAVGAAAAELYPRLPLDGAGDGLELPNNEPRPLLDDDLIPPPPPPPDLLLPMMTRNRWRCWRYGMVWECQLDCSSVRQYCTVRCRYQYCTMDVCWASLCYEDEKKMYV